MILKTQRLLLRPWTEADEPGFTMLHADPIVMEDQGGPLDPEESRVKLLRYMAAFRQYQYGRWLVETIDGRFLGYCGVMPVRRVHPIGPHDEIGWRLLPSAWGNGYATEAAQAALNDAFDRVGLTEVLAYTAANNLRSQSVMSRLGLTRDASRDFTTLDSRLGKWEGLVWKAEKAAVLTHKGAPTSEIHS